MLRVFIYLTVVALAVAATWFQLTHHKSAPLANYKQVPDFQLTERSGKPFTLSDLKGKVWVADFFYASCPGPCPMISSKLSALQDQVIKLDDVRLVSISTQPDTDTPEVLRQYAEKFHASDKWFFLTGAKDQIFNLSNKGFLLTAADQNSPAETAPVIHSTKLALVDKNGAIRGYYEGEDEASLKLIVDDIKKLLKE